MKGQDPYINGKISSGNPVTIQEMYARIIDISRSMITIINRDYRYEGVNETFCREHGVESGSLIGKTLSDIWGKEAFQNHIKERLDRCFTGETVKYEASFPTALRGERYFEVVFRPILEEMGEIRWLMAETFDVNEVRQNEIAARRKEQELYDFEVFADGIAHDFNNILTTISGYSEMLREDLPEGSPLAAKVRRIQDAVGKAKLVTDKLLAWGRDPLTEKRLVDAGRILDETIGFIRMSLPGNIIIKRRITREDAGIMADPIQLFRVFLNVMTNAVQSMKEKGGSLAISMSVTDAAGLKGRLRKKTAAPAFLVVNFRDTGGGMDPGIRKRIFEPYYTTRGNDGGLGLGLSVTYAIVSDLGGDIRVISRKGSGTSFRIYLPVSR